MDREAWRATVHGDSPGNNTQVGCHALLQGIFPTQGSNPHLLCLLHWQLGSLPLALPGKRLPLTYPAQIPANAPVSEGK